MLCCARRSNNWAVRVSSKVEFIDVGCGGGYLLTVAALDHAACHTIWGHALRLSHKRVIGRSSAAMNMQRFKA